MLIPDMVAVGVVTLLGLKSLQVTVEPSRKVPTTCPVTVRFGAVTDPFAVG
jgi:hypothetical protein